MGGEGDGGDSGPATRGQAQGSRHFGSRELSPTHRLPPPSSPPRLTTTRPNITEFNFWGVSKHSITPGKMPQRREGIPEGRDSNQRETTREQGLEKLIKTRMCQGGKLIAAVPTLRDLVTSCANITEMGIQLQYFINSLKIRSMCHFCLLILRYKVGNFLLSHTAGEFIIHKRDNQARQNRVKHSPKTCRSSTFLPLGKINCKRGTRKKKSTLKKI